MSATPPRVSARRALHEQTPSEQNRLQVRLVPYSPPRLSFDGSLSALSRSGSGIQDLTAPRPASPASPLGGTSSKAKHYHQQLHEPAAAPSRSKLPSIPSDRKPPSLPASCSASSAAHSSWSARRSSTILSSPRRPSTSILLVDDHSGSPLTPLDEEFPTQAPTPTPARSRSASPSSWNHRFVGGLRKGHRRASRAGRTGSGVSKSPGSSPRLMSRLRKKPPATSRLAASPPNASTSFESSPSTSERPNYNVYANSSPAPGDLISDSLSTDLEAASLDSSQTNVVVLGDSSSGLSAEHDRAFIGQADYHVVGGGLPTRLRLRADFSRDSLLVPPLQPPRGDSTDQPGVLTSHARSRSSVSSVVMESFPSLLPGPSPVNLPSESFRDGSPCRPAGRGRWAFFRRPQWNSALSTVAVGGEALSEGRSHAPSSVSTSSGRGSRDQVVPASAVGHHPAPPSPIHRRLSNREQNRGVRLIRDQDEHGDGLADLEALHHHPSRSRMQSLLSSYPSDRNLRSSSSSRRSSLSRSSVPAWARVYYGSGERRWLAAKLSKESMFSDFTGDSRGSAFPSRSPSVDLFPAIIRSPRRRPHERIVSMTSRSCTASCADIDDTAPYTITPFASRLRAQPSSIWSPHLRRDRRAIGYGIWEPPSAVWSTNRVWLSRQNTQPILFVAGFVFPLAWMVASFLPLPPIPRPEMAQVDLSTSHVDLRLEANPPTDVLDMRLHNHARWWRTLNRAMAIVGIFVIGAIIALVIFGVRQQWR